MADTKAQGVVLPAPVNGVDFFSPITEMDPKNTPWMNNAECENQYVRLRNGKRMWGYINNASVLSSMFVYNGVTDKIYACPGSTNNVYEFTASGAASSVSATAGATITLLNSVNFAGYVLTFSLQSVWAPFKKYNGSAWSLFTYTFVTGSFAPFMAVSYKGRLYMVGTGMLIFEYTDISAISGASTHAVDLTSIFTSGFSFSFVATFSISTGSTDSEYIAFGNDKGQVLVYGGDYPDSPTWGLKARFTIGKPIGLLSSGGYSPVIPFQNDSLILTETGLISLKAVFQSGSNNGIYQTLTKKIDPYWRSLIAAQRAHSSDASYLSWSGVFWPDKNKIIIAANGFIEKDGSFSSGTKVTFFSLNVDSGAWSIHSSSKITPNIGNLVYANNQVYFPIMSQLSWPGGGGTVISVFQYEDTTNYYDNSSSNWSVGPTATEGNYAFEIDGAWNSFGDQIKSKKVSSFETLVYTDLFKDSGSLTLQTGADFGEHTSAACEVSLVAAEAGYKKLQYNAGGEGTFFQYQIIGNSGSTNNSTFGYKLFSVNAILQVGGIGV